MGFVPKLVDHEERRLTIAEAAWRVVLRHGVAGVSVRAVAAEADLATASLRQAFPSQDELLGFCFELVVERAGARISALVVDGGARERAEQAVLEVLPLDRERQAEMQVWLAFAAASLAQPRLAPTYDRGHDALRGLCRSVVESLGPGPDPAVEAVRLHALVDGLAMHLVARHDPHTVDLARRALTHHLDDLGRAGHLPAP